MQADLSRFLTAQLSTYQTALDEIKQGNKQSHWMWFIFPQLQGLGYSETAKYYALANIEEAKAYLNHPILGARLQEITQALLHLEQRNPTIILGHPDDKKLQSCMTLFSQIDIREDSSFKQVIDQFYQGEFDKKTLQLLGL